jgi:hypothetical protein
VGKEGGRLGWGRKGGRLGWGRREEDWGGEGEGGRKIGVREGEEEFREAGSKGEKGRGGKDR